MDDTDHGELQIEMTKPIEAIYRSDSAEKLKRAENKRKAKFADRSMTQSQKGKTKHTFQDSSYLNMTLSDSYTNTDYKNKNNTHNSIVKTNPHTGPGSYEITGDLAQPNKFYRPKRTTSPASHEEDISMFKSTFTDYKKYEKMYQPGFEKEQLMTESPAIIYNPR